MAWTLEFKIRNIKVKDVVDEDGNTMENAVFQTYWDVVGTNENGETEEQAGALPLQTSNIDPATFKPFDQLVEADVSGWIAAWYDANPDMLANLKNDLDRAYARRTEREIGGSELPWYEPPAEAEDSSVDPSNDPSLIDDGE